MRSRFCAAADSLEGPKHHKPLKNNNEYRVQVFSVYVCIYRGLHPHYIIKQVSYSQKKEMHKYSNNYHKKNARQTSPTADVLFLYKILHLHNNVQRKYIYMKETFTS